MGSSPEGSLPRQKWVSVNSAGAFPASQYFLRAWHPGRLDLCLQPRLLLPGNLAPQTLLSDFDQGTQFSFLCRTDETGLCRTLAASLSSTSSQGKHIKQHVVATSRRTD